MQKVILYGTAICQLCDKAKDVIYPLLDNLPVEFVEEDILLNDAVFERYRYRIPVLVNALTQTELAWPFDQNRFLDWLNESA